MNKLTAILFACVLGVASCGSSDDTASDDTTAATATQSDDTASESNDDSATTEAETETTEAESTGGDTSGDEAALIAALDAVGVEENGDTFSEEEIHCANTTLVNEIGMDNLKEIGITADNPDDSLLPQEYEYQVIAVKAITDCMDLGVAFASLVEDCDLSDLGNDVMEAAMRYDFLSEFAEYDENGDAEASATFNAAIEACSIAS